MKNTKPGKDVILLALRVLCEWATGPNRAGNPYCHEPVRQALMVLDRAYGGTGSWMDAIDTAKLAKLAERVKS